MLTLFDELWARCLTPNESGRSSLAGNLSPLSKTRTSPLPSTSRGALQKTAGNKVLPQDKKEEVEVSHSTELPSPVLYWLPTLRGLGGPIGEEFSLQ